MDKFNILSVATAGAGTILTFLFGGWDVALIVLVVFIVLDYVTGVLAAIVKKNLSSEVGWKGLIKKAVILIVLIVAVMLDRLLGSEQWAVRTVVCYFFVANEGISLLENAASLGIPVPSKLLDILAQIRGKGEKSK